MLSLIDMSRLVKAAEIASDWFVILLTIAVLSRHWRVLGVLTASNWRNVETCEFAKAAAQLLLIARAIMCAFAVVGTTTPNAIDDLGRAVSNFITALAVIPLFVALERPSLPPDLAITLVQLHSQPDPIGKLYRLLLILYIGTFTLAACLFIWFSR